MDVVGPTRLTLAASAEAGDLLTPSTDGKGVPVKLSAGNRVGALAVADGQAGDDVLVVLTPALVGPAAVERAKQNVAGMPR